MSATTSALQRRMLRFESLAEVLADAERLATARFRTIGKWSFGQILDHLARGMDIAIDGTEFKAPWFARKLIAPFVKNSFLTKPMRAGFQLPESAKSLLPSEAVSVEVGMEHLKQSMERFNSEPRLAPHPFLGNMASQEWLSLTLRHAELHLSFVLPEA